MYYPEFKIMHEIYDDVENEFYKVHTVHASKGNPWDEEYRGQKEQEVVVLRDLKKREIVMSDSWMEQKSNIDLVRQANGHVLIGGLGIGMVILALQDKPEVVSVTVVEIDQNLYDTVMPQLKPHLNDKVKIVIQDIHNFIPDRKYDVIYCDIWNDISSDNWDEMKDLTKKFKYQVNRDNPKCLLDHWRKDRTRQLVAEDNSGGW